MRKRINDVAAISAVIVFLFILFVNVRVFSAIGDFMDEHNASRYEEVYRAPQAYGGAMDAPVTIRFVFYDQSGEQLRLDVPTQQDFFDINKLVLNYIDTSALLTSIFFIITASALLVSVKDRYNISGLILLLIFCFVLLSVDPILKFSLIPLGVIALGGSYLTFKSRFVDYNQNRFLTFNKN